MNTPTKQLTLCADDFGQNAEVSTGILNLLAKQRLSAVSCLTTFPDWSLFAKKLLIYQDEIDIGLHFNLTENSLFPDLSSLMRTVYFGKLDKELLESELHIQLDCFIEATGKLPDFIDGHQHVHHLPIVRDVLLKVYKIRLQTNHAYLRSCQTLSLLQDFPKNLIIQLTGARALKKILQKQHIPHNSSFAGIYDFKHAKNYRDYFNQFLQQITDRGLIMCHPGLFSEETSDPLANSRRYEYQYFMSDEFLQDCSSYKLSKLITGNL